MLNESMEINKKNGVCLLVNIGQAGTIGYAMAWLKLCNNAREYPKVIWKVENNARNNNVYVYCSKHDADTQVRDFCNNLYNYYDKENNKYIKVGEVFDEFDCVVGFANYIWDSDAETNEGWDRDEKEIPTTWAAVDDN